MVFRRWYVVLAVGALALAAGSRPAPAEPDLQSIVNTVSSGKYKFIDPVSGPFLGYFFKAAMGQTVGVTAHWAGHTTELGWYDPFGAGSQSLGTYSAMGSVSEAPKTINTSNPFGLWFKDVTAGQTFYTETSKNTQSQDSGTFTRTYAYFETGLPGSFTVSQHVHVMLYQNTVTPTTWYIGFEDLMGDGSDRDYQDLVVELTGAQLVPEAGALQFAAFAGLGVLCLMRRRRA